MATLQATELVSRYVSTMEFRVLGPLEVLTQGERLDLGGRKQRTVLALLVASAGFPVSTDRLIEGVYGDDAPDRARRSVQTFVSNLRSQLGDQIISVPTGYEFRPIDSSVDVVEFVAQFKDGQSLLEDDPLEASAVLQAALAQWRGHPYADVDAHTELESEITRLNELRLAALESRIEADLSCGLDRELIGELQALTAEYPLQEAFRSQYMLALYRAGRQSEALRAYSKMREHLAEELGVDPSPTLRALEQRILEQDPSLLLARRTDVRQRAVLVIDLTNEALGGPDERQRILADVDGAVERSIASAAGVVASQEGTATYGTFGDVRSAIDAAVAVSRGAPRINGSPVVRIGLDVGDVEEMPGGEVGGPAVIRAAGLVAAAHPGQVLLSADAQAAAADDDVGGAVLRTLGRHRIPRLEDPESVHQLVVDGLSEKYPDLLTGQEPPELPVTRVGVPGYELREVLGHGLFGTVYRGYQPSVGREVAIKVIRPELANKAGFIRRFAVEANMVSRLEHPNVVPLYDFWRGPDGALLVMSLMRGGNLDDVAGELDRGSALRLVDQIGGALATAHDLGISHGDVHVGNVLLNESGDFFLGDFGIAAESADFMPPAMQSDVVSFACMVREVAGDHVFEAPELEVLDAACSGSFDTASGLVEQWRTRVGAAKSSSTFTPTRNPYKGLAAFSELDSSDFFGRTDVVEELLGAVGAHRLVGVVGPSGIGKSSVIRAGLLPALRSGASPGSEDWMVADCSPGAHPFERLASALVRVASTLPDGLEDLLRGSSRGLVKAVDRYLPAGSTLLLIVDQFEELFTLTPNVETRDGFLDLLTSAVQDSGGNVRVVVTIRADFFDRPLRHAAFGQLLRTGTVAISAPTDDQLREIITRPAMGVGVDFDAAIVERIIGEVQGQTGALPLVEFALTELFEARKSDSLTRDDYEQSGGVLVAVGRRAEHAYRSLDKRVRPAARQIFMRLVTPGDGDRDTRRRVRRTELEHLGLSAEVVGSVLDTFGRERLLTFDRDETTRGPTIEVAHEALLEEWPRLRKWIDRHREELLLHRRLTAAAEDWEASGHRDQYLLAGGQLAQHEAWSGDTKLRLSAAETEFLESSRQVADAHQQRRIRTRRLIMGGFAAAAIVALVLAGFAIRGQRQAEDAKVAALASQALELVDSDPALALGVALEADRIRSTVDTRGAVLATLEAFTGRRGLHVATLSAFEGAVWSIAYTADGSQLVGGSDALLGVQVWDVTTRQAGSALADWHESSVRETALTADGRIVTTSLDDVAQVRQLASGNLIATFEGHESDIWALDVHEPSNQGVTGSRDGTARIWDLATGTEVAVLDAAASTAQVAEPPERNTVWAVRFTPDGSHVATGGADGMVRLWDAASGAEIWAMPAHDAAVLDLAITASGDRLLTASEDGTVLAFAVDSGDRIGGPLAHEDGLEAIALSADGSRLLTGGSEGQAVLWDIATGSKLATMDGHDGRVADVAFDPGSGLITTAGTDGTIQLWDPEPSPGATVMLGHGDGAGPFESASRVLTMAIHPDGETLLTGGADATARTWDWTTAEPRLEMRDARDRVFAVAISPDGQTYAGGTRDAQVWVWDSATGTAQATFDVAARVNGLGFTPDGEHLIVGTEDGLTVTIDLQSGSITEVTGVDSRFRVAVSASGLAMGAGLEQTTIWDVGSGSVVAELVDTEAGFRGGAVVGIFSPDESLVATGSGGRVLLWDAESGDRLATLTGHVSDVRSLAFSPDGGTLVSGSTDFTANLWDVESRRLMATWRRHVSLVDAVGFTTDGDWVVTASSDGTIRTRYAGVDQDLICDWLEPYMPTSDLKGALSGATPGVCF